MISEVIYTIGHSTHSAERFVELLTCHGITAVADVRSHPRSRFNPRFNQDSLVKDLKKAGIAYVFLGRELGARSDDPGCYVQGRVSYECLASLPLFEEGLKRLGQGAQKYRIVLMCAEKDPLTCHRAILVGRHLTERGVRVEHILEDGRIETHDEALSRLLSELGLDRKDLFRSRDELILDAYDQRGRQIAYQFKESGAELIGETE